MPEGPIAPPPYNVPLMASRSTFPIAAKLGLLALGVAVVGVLLALAVRPTAVPKRFGIVEPGKIYRSGEMTPAALEWAHKKFGIRTVVDLGAYPLGSADERREQLTAEALGITRYRLPLEGDATGNPNYYVQALRVLSDASKHPVLIHCNAGAQRTGCAVLLYRRIIQGKDFYRAFEETGDYDHDLYDNPRLLLTVAEWGYQIGEAYRENKDVPGVASVPALAPMSSDVGPSQSR